MSYIFTTIVLTLSEDPKKNVIYTVVCFLSMTKVLTRFGLEYIVKNILS